MTRRSIKPWTPPEPGFRFYTEEMREWLHGYEPTAAYSHASTAQFSAAARRGSGEPGVKRFGSIGGTIEGMGPAKRRKRRTSGKARSILQTALDSRPELQRVLK